MSYTFEKVSSNKVKLSFVVAAADFEAAVQKAYLKGRNKIAIPGFRKGKAPRKVIETMYGKGVFYEDAIDAMFPEMYQEAVDAEKIDAVDRPSMTEINWNEVENGADLKFTVEVFVRPDVTLGDYKGLTVEVAPITVTEEQVDARIKQDQTKASRMVDVLDRPVAEGDTVNLDYSGSVDGEKFNGGTAEGQTLKIGSKQFIPGFEEQMIGMCIGEERDLNVTFPEQYHSEELAGKAAVFHVKVNNIQMTEVPELDDEFAADVSEFNTFAEYKADIEKKMKEAAEKNYEIAVENALVMKAVENATVEIPEAMINDSANDILNEMAYRMSMQGIRFDDYLKYIGQTVEQVRDSYKGEAQQRVKTELVLNAIIAAEGIEATEEDIEKETAEQAERMGRPVDEFKASLNDQQRGYLKNMATSQKAVALMKADATIVEPKAEEAAPADAE